MLAPLLAAALAAAPQPSPGDGPSFDCAAAAGFAEHAICDDPSLARRDRDLAALYARTLAASQDPPALRRAARRALGERGLCRTKVCVQAWFVKRTTALSAAGPRRLQVGQCLRTTVSLVGSRLEGVPGSGSSIAYADGHRQVSYDAVPSMDGSHPGDPVRLCLKSVPTHCPPGDDRGSIYGARNLRTGAAWTAGDSQHQCGGA